jgi:alpha-methylacyl-CoA racemase
MSGPLRGIRIVEIGGIGPVPFCGMMLADHGAVVIQVNRLGAPRRSPDVLARSRYSIDIDLKKPQGRELVIDLCRDANGLIEGFRPGVMERLGLGPENLQAINPAIVYGRMTGWGQHGPLSATAGHDINYIAVSGVLHGIGVDGHKPAIPLNLLGDFGGGAMMLAFGMVAAILHSKETGQGQIIDCAMTDGSALLTAMMWSMVAQGRWRDERGVNLLDGGAHFYETYETADGKAIALGAIEPQFYNAMLDRLGLSENPAFANQMDETGWPLLRERLAALIRTRSRDEWSLIFEGSDACFAPVLSLQEAPKHPHNVARDTFIEIDGVIQPAPAPRYSRTVNNRPVTDGGDLGPLLASLGYDQNRMRALQREGIVGEIKTT